MVLQGHVVLLHAFPLNATLWRSQVASAPAGWQFVAPDLPGFGASTEAPVDSFDAMGGSVLRGLDALGIERAVIGGLSMGGYLTLALYRMAPERFAGMILADTRATADTEQLKAGRQKVLATVRDKGPSAIADEMLPKLLGATSHRERPELTDDVREMIVGNSADAIAGAVTAIMNRPDSTSMLASISVPTLILCGDEDVLTPPADAEALHAGIRNSRLVVLPRAGHLSNLEAPDAFSAAVQEFLTGLKS